MASAPRSGHAPEPAGAHDVWRIEQVVALAPRATTLTAAQGLAVAARWRDAGCTSTVLWGRCSGGSSEPYDCWIEHRQVLFRCTCPSRVQPCKHTLALLLLWVGGGVPSVGVDRVPPRVAALVAAAVAARPDASTAPDPSPRGDLPVRAHPGPAPEPTSGPAAPRLPDPSSERSMRTRAGLAELSRWIDDRMRTGLADPALARYATWDDLAARLVDAQLGGLANRVRRLAGAVGARSDWHEYVVAELGLLHLLAEAGGRLHQLPVPLAESVAAALGWQVRQSDVLAGVSDTDRWVVLGRSDTREDRIEVRRWWLRGLDSGRWAMLLSFAAYGQSLDDEWRLGDVVSADVHRYPGALGLRALVGRRHHAPERATATELALGAATIGRACDEIGSAIAREPWLDRWPVCIRATPTRAGEEWLLTDDEGALPIGRGALTPLSVATLLACSAGSPRVIVAEWSPAGVLPVAVHLDDRSVDVGPTADPGFVSSERAR